MNQDHKTSSLNLQTNYLLHLMLIVGLAGYYTFSHNTIADSCGVEVDLHSIGIWSAFALFCRFFLIAEKSMDFFFRIVIIRGGVEDTSFVAKAKAQKIQD